MKRTVRFWLPLWLGTAACFAFYAAGYVLVAYWPSPWREMADLVRYMMGG
jgi:hypothetical protein